MRPADNNDAYVSLRLHLPSSPPGEDSLTILWKDQAILRR
jgi:hypothetical protein